jgi:hypothetical protein
VDFISFFSFFLALSCRYNIKFVIYLFMYIIIDNISQGSADSNVPAPKTSAAGTDRTLVIRGNMKFVV